MRDEQEMYDMLWLWRSTYYADPNNWVGEMYACDQIGAETTHGIATRRSTNFLWKQDLNLIKQKEQKTMKKASQMVTDDAGISLFIIRKWFGPYNHKIKGVRFSPIGNAQKCVGYTLTNNKY